MAENIDIARLAKLSRLRIAPEDMPRFEAAMRDIVNMVEHLPDFEDTSLPLDAADAMELREDEVRPSMPRAEVLKNAPQVEAGCVVVPRVVE